MISNYLAFKQILLGASVTIVHGEAFVHSSRYNEEYFEFEFAELLSKLTIIDEDSGNWETGEVHYYFNREFVEIKNGVRVIQMKKIEELFDGPWHDTTKLKIIVDRLKTSELRKAKLKKLERMYEKIILYSQI